MFCISIQVSFHSLCTHTNNAPRTHPSVLETAPESIYKPPPSHLSYLRFPNPDPTGRPPSPLGPHLSSPHPPSHPHSSFFSATHLSPAIFPPSPAPNVPTATPATVLKLAPYQKDPIQLDRLCQVDFEEDGGSLCVASSTRRLPGGQSRKGEERRGEQLSRLAGYDKYTERCRYLTRGWAAGIGRWWKGDIN